MLSCHFWLFITILAVSHIHHLEKVEVEVKKELELEEEMDMEDEVEVEDLPGWTVSSPTPCCPSPSWLQADCCLQGRPWSF